MPCAAAAHHERDLRVGLVAADAVDDVAARLLQPSRPADVRLLVEAREQLHEHRDLLAVLRRPRERADDRRVAARPVERLLDREHVGVVRGRGDERHHRVERLVGVVEDHVALVEEGEERGARRFDHGLRLERRVAQVLERGQVDEGHQRPDVHRPPDAVDVVRRDLEPRHEEREQRLGDPVLDLEADDAAPPAVLELLLDDLQEVPPALVVEVELGVARDAEGGHVADLLPREEARELGPDHVLEQHVDEALDARRPHEPREPPGDLHDREPRLVLALRRARGARRG